jgi:predicted hydrocarbon binding protein
MTIHGILLKGLKEFVVERYDRRTWNEVRDESTVERKVYLPIETYDDGELTALVEAMVDVTDLPADELLEAYGRSVSTRLLTTYDNVIDDDWSAADLVERVDDAVHGQLREHNGKIHPPELDCERVSPQQIRVQYRSSRQLCPVARGIVYGIGDHYGESFGVDERQCVHDGDDVCEFLVTHG